MDVELRSTDDVKPYESNPRVNDQAVDAVANSIREFGFRQPIVVDAAGVILVGHTRWKAAKKLGLAKVPVHVAKDLSPDQARAYRIADNATQDLAEWNMELLRREAAELVGKIDLGQFGLDVVALGQVAVIQPPDLPAGDRAPLQEMTFTLSDDQAERVKLAMTKAKGLGPFTDTGNENGNGNALARIAEAYLG